MGLEIVNLSNYEIPTVKEVYNKDWVCCFGDDNNDYFDRSNRLDTMTVSATNARCVSGIV